MKHEKALYQYLLENFPALDTERDNFSVHQQSGNSSFKIYHSKRYGFEVCARDEEDETGEAYIAYYFDDRSDQGFDPITAREALGLLKGGEA